MAGELTTLYLYKLYAGIDLTDTSNDAQLQQIITDMSGLIADKCNRTFALTTYKEWYDGTGTNRMLLPEWPIVNIYKMAITRFEAIDVIYTGAGSHASVQFDGTTVTLQHIDVNGDEQTTELLVATYKVMSTLAAAIDLVSDWSATVASGHDTDATTFMRPVLAYDALTTATGSFEVPEDGERVNVTSETNRAIERQGGGTYPVGRYNVFVWYKAGYTLPVDNAGHTALDVAGNLPGGLVSTVNKIVKDTFKTSTVDTTLTGETIHDYSYRRGGSGSSSGYGDSNQSALDAHMSDLSAYCKIEV